MESPEQSVKKRRWVWIAIVGVVALMVGLSAFVVTRPSSLERAVQELAARHDLEQIDQDGELYTGPVVMEERAMSLADEIKEIAIHHGLANDGYWFERSPGVGGWVNGWVLRTRHVLASDPEDVFIDLTCGDDQPVRLIFVHKPTGLKGRISTWLRSLGGP